MANILYLKDREEFSIIVNLEPSSNDPLLQIPALAMVYRVVANSFGPTLTVVPLADKPTLLTEVRNQ